MHMYLDLYNFVGWKIQFRYRHVGSWSFWGFLLYHWQYAIDTIYVSFTSAVYELGHNTVHVFLLGVPNQTPSCFYFEACLFIQTTMWFSQIQGTEGNVYFNRFIENRMKKKTTIHYYKPQVVVLFSLWNNSYMYHARGLLNRFWLTFSSSSFIQRGVDLDTCEWQCWKCVRVCQQRKNSYTAVSNGSNINLPKQSVFMNSIL